MIEIVAQQYNYGHIPLKKPISLVPFCPKITYKNFLYNRDFFHIIETFYIIETFFTLHRRDL